MQGSAVVTVGYTWDPAATDQGDAVVARFDPALQLKHQTEWGAGDADEEWFGDVVLDGKGAAYVTGYQSLNGSTGYSKAVTVKFDPALSKAVWTDSYKPAAKDTEGCFIARDGLGYVYVAGLKDGADGYEDFLTVKYSPSGKRKWLKTWSGGGPDHDEPFGLVLGTQGGVYVGGQVTGKGDISQAALVKYRR